MKEWWNRQCSRIDALELRERLLLLLSVVACCVAAADTLWLSPAQDAQKKLVAAVMRENAELETLRTQLRASTQASQGANATSAAREQIAQKKMRIEQVNREIVGASSLTEKSNSLPQVLVQFLRRHERLTLIRTATIAGGAGGAGGAAEVAAAKPLQTATAGPAASSIRRQGLELTVAGPYLELMEYVRTLEQALPTLRWGSMRLNSEKMPPQLTLQVFLVGVQP